MGLLEALKAAYSGQPGDFGSQVRYGMPAAEVERLSHSGALHQPAGLTPEEEQRFGAGYLFAKNWPNAAPVAQKAADVVHNLAINPILKAGQSDIVKKYLPSVSERLALPDTPGLQELADRGGDQYRLDQVDQADMTNKVRVAALQRALGGGGLP